MVEKWIKREENFFLQNRTPLKVLELYQIEKVISLSSIFGFTLPWRMTEAKVGVVLYTENFLSVLIDVLWSAGIKTHVK